MDLVDVIKWEMNERELVHKFESEELRLGSQLVVYPGQTAFFVKGGKIMDEFGSGTYTIKNENIPLLGKVINIPFNGESPFKAEVWFVNQVSFLNNKWGTMSPILVEDPKYEVIVPVRAHGQYGFRVENPRLFLERLVGNMPTFEKEKIVDYFKGVLLSKLTTIVYDALNQTGQSAVNISSQVERISEMAQEKLTQVFADYGVGLELFSIYAISVKEDDRSFIRLKEAKDFAARLKVTGRDVYQMERSFDVLEKAAGNSGGGMVSMGVGMGAGLNMGNAIGQMAAQQINTNPVAPPPVASTYYIYMNGQQLSGQTEQNIAVMLSLGVINSNTLVWQQGWSAWLKISQVPNLAQFSGGSATPPPIPPTI